MQLVLTLLAVWVLADAVAVVLWAAFPAVLRAPQPAAPRAAVRVPGPRRETAETALRQGLSADAAAPAASTR